MNNENITRAEALKKMGKYAAFTALGTMIILNPKTAQAMSGPSGHGNGHGHGGGNSGGGNGNGGNFGGRRKRGSIFNN
tara:strand:- start:387 stop:620 length:234 start_codon:yes stop_codon:yes gene_type:complete